MTWELAKPYGIQVDTLGVPGSTFHGGRMIDVLIPNVAAFLAASDSSGVWRVNQSTSDAIPLSLLWENTSVQCLAHDIGDHVYAGCGNTYNTPPSSEFLYETDRSKPVPSDFWLPVLLPSQINTVHDIVVVVVEQERNVVLATNAGLWWSPVPSTGVPYSWHQAAASESIEFFSVCAGPDGQIVAGAMYPNIANGIWPLYTGYPDSSSTMTVNVSFLPKGIDPASLGRTTVDSSAWTLGMFVYALSVDDNGTPVCVMLSTSGGLSWSLCGTTLNHAGETGSITDKKLTGDNASGGVIHRITASHASARGVAFGLLHGYLSSDGGDSWTTIGGPFPADPELHDDVHVVAFDPNDKSGKRLVLASDGGLASASELTPIRDHNEGLTNIQMYTTASLGHLNGRFAISTTPDLAFGGLQDNGNIYTELSDPTGPWHQLDRFDGGSCFLIRARDGSVVAARNLAAGTADYHHLYNAKWDPAAGAFPLGGTGAPLLATDGSFTDDLEARLELVTAPVFRDLDGRLMYAVGWTPESTSARLYGLFADDDGSNLCWQVVGGWLPKITIRAAASYDGTEILAVAPGADGASSYRIAPALGDVPPFGELGTITEFTPDVLPVDSKGGGDVHLIRASGPNTYCALYNGAKGTGAVLASYHSGESWEQLGTGSAGALPNAPFTGLAVVDGPPRVPGQRLVACTDHNVYLSDDSGDTWTDISAGLPHNPHCAGLEARESSDHDSTDVYLSTYGWSLWHTNIG